MFDCVNIGFIHCKHTNIGNFTKGGVNKKNISCLLFSVSSNAKILLCKSSKVMCNVYNLQHNLISAKLGTLIKEISEKKNKNFPLLY